MTNSEALARLGGGFISGETDSAQRPVSEKLEDIVSVKDFGAVGDGQADDTFAVQAALETRKAVYFPTGTYKCTSTITLKRGATLIGTTRSRYGGADDTYGRSVLKFEGLSAGQYCLAAWTAQDFFNVHLSDLHIDGSGTAHGLSLLNPGRTSREISIYNCSFKGVVNGIVSERCWATSFDQLAINASGTAIIWEDGTTCRWSNLFLDGALGGGNRGQVGISIDGGLDNCTIDGGFIQNYDVGIKLNEKPQLRVTGMDFEYMDSCVELVSCGRTFLTLDSCNFAMGAGGDVILVSDKVQEGSRIYILAPGGPDQWFAGTTFTVLNWAGPPQSYFLRLGPGAILQPGVNQEAIFIQEEYWPRLSGGIPASVVPYISLIRSRRISKPDFIKASSGNTIPFSTFQDLLGSKILFDANSGLYENTTQNLFFRSGACYSLTASDNTGSIYASTLYLKTQGGNSANVEDTVNGGVPLTVNTGAGTVTIGGADLSVIIRVA